jgi:UDP-N-acetylmuramoyl-L-alanyl-D-glutamate--2,6-diaminopimelate ligase
MQAWNNLAGGVRLRELLSDAEFLGAADVLVGACASDSRRVEPGWLFAALPGSRGDGRAFLAEALAAGCGAVLAEPPVPPLPVPVCLVPNAREAYGRICQALAGDPSRTLKLVGITGTNGKTTTACLIASVLSEAGGPVGLLGTLGYFDGHSLEEAPWTTPPAEKLAELLRRMVLGGCSHAVMEVSSHALAQWRVAGCRFDAACVTNVTRDHLDYHGSLGDYRLAKSRLLEHLAPEGFAVVNADDPTSVGYLRRFDGPALSIGIRAAAEITGTLVEQFPSEQTFLLTAGTDTIPVRTRMIGTHHVYNCLVAAAVGLAYGIELPAVVRGLESVQSVPGRLERIECGQPFGVFVDFAHTPDALGQVLAALGEVTAGRLLCVFGAGGERDRAKRPLMGRAVEQGADSIIVTSDNPRREDPQQIADDILAGMRRREAARVILDREEAIHTALGAAQPGDTVLIAGKGHEDRQIVGEAAVPFDDRQIARDWLYAARPLAHSPS